MSFETKPAAVPQVDPKPYTFVFPVATVHVPRREVDSRPPERLTLNPKP